MSAGTLFVVGLGPGERALMTGQALEALSRAEVHTSKGSPKVRGDVPRAASHAWR